MIKKIKKIVRVFLNYKKWKKQEKNSDPSCCPILYDINNFEGIDLGKILILVPHADDEWIGTSQVLLNNKNVEIYYFEFLGGNYDSKNKEVRNNELMDLCSTFHIKINKKMEGNGHEYSLGKLIKEKKYDTIFVPPFFDWHEEHVEANYILHRLLNNQKELRQSISNLYFYQISVPLPKQLNFFYYPMSRKSLKNKKSLFQQKYSSQMNLPIERFNTQDRLNAVNSKYYSVEIYANLNYQDWTDLLSFIKKEMYNFRSTLSSNINNVSIIRVKTNNLYSQYENNK